MWIPKKGYENTTINYRLGLITIQIRVEDIQQSHIDTARKYNIDLTYYLERYGFDEPQHEDLIELQKDEPEKKTRKRKKK